MVGEEFKMVMGTSKQLADKLTKASDEGWNIWMQMTSVINAGTVYHYQLMQRMKTYEQ